MLNSDLAGKGIIRIPKHVVRPKAKGKAAAAKPIWTGKHPTFGAVLITKKNDIKKDTFACLVKATASGCAGSQLCQASPMSVKYDIQTGIDLMVALAERMIKDGITQKSELNPLRDKIRNEEFKARIDALPDVQKPTTDKKQAKCEGAQAAGNAGGADHTDQTTKAADKLENEQPPFAQDDADDPLEHPIA